MDRSKAFRAAEGLSASGPTVNEIIQVAKCNDRAMPTGYSPVVGGAAIRDGDAVVGPGEDSLSRWLSERMAERASDDVTITGA